ncbi:MAG: peptide chain release factor N(5)-glutamine methyltransferase [Rubrobacter sp.]
MKVSLTNAREAMHEATRLLREARVPEPQASAEVLLSELLGIRRGEIPFHKAPLRDEQISDYRAMISRRLDREPVQRILGRAYFRNLELELVEATLIPRPDTESVVEAALQVIDRREGPCRVLDLGTGTGAIAISISQERPTCDVHASDISEAALEAARHNARKNCVTITLHRSDLGHGLAGLEGSVDVLVSNPPYIERETLAGLEPEVRDWDPSLALDGGLDGLGFYRRIFDEVKPLLKPTADVILEIGDGQAEDVVRLGEEAGFKPTDTYCDLAGSVRAVILKWGG